jgi:short-subunit dehydrogenase
MKLDGKRVVITGASRGIGEVLAGRCAARGAQVALVARTEDKLRKLAADYGGDAYPADLSDVAAVAPLVRAIEADGPIDVLVNNAGLGITDWLTEMPVTEIEQTLAVNLITPMLLVRAVVPGMLQRGGGHIVNVSSLAGTNVVPGLAAYSTTKAGLSHFTAALRAEYKGRPIRTTLVELGLVQTDMVKELYTHEPTRRAVRRLEMLRLAVTIDVDGVVDNIVDAIEHDRRHVRMPKRDALFPLLSEAPRRMSEWLLAGVKAK